VFDPVDGGETGVSELQSNIASQLIGFIIFVSG